MRSIKARDTRLDRHVAIKVLPRDVGQPTPRGSARFAYEARADRDGSLIRTSARFYDIGHHDGVDFLVMEFLAGGNAGGAPAQRTPAACRGSCASAIEIAEALAAAHAAGHRASRPEAGQRDAGGRPPGTSRATRGKASRFRSRCLPCRAAVGRSGNTGSPRGLDHDAGP